MLNIEEVKNTIIELEKGDTTFANCQKLASLYIVLDHFKNSDTSEEHNSDAVTTELGDILPEYKAYCEVKRKYQMHEVTERAVELAMKDVCQEIKEFIFTLYNNTEMQSERDEIQNMLTEIKAL